VEYVASNGQQALEMVSINRPDVSIIDITMPGIDGIKVAKKIKDLNLNTKVIILAMHKNEAIFNLARIVVLLATLLKIMLLLIS
ncbi:MAG: response regulator, partial [Flavobacteriales bacterium]|nr:response regulator [Flavobacteriales bacterium]